MKTYLVKYSKTNNDVLGYFIKGNAYNGNVIDLLTKTIDGEPFIEITDLQYKQGQGVRMVVINDNYEKHQYTNEEILQQVKQEVSSQVVAQRKQEQFSTVEYKGNVYFATEKARGNLFMAWSIAKELKEEELPWLDVNNKKVVLTLKEAFDIIVLLRNRDNSLYQNEAVALTQIAVLTSPEQVNAIGSYKTTPPTTIEGSEGLFNTNATPASGLE